MIVGLFILGPQVMPDGPKRRVFFFTLLLPVCPQEASGNRPVTVKRMIRSKTTVWFKVLPYSNTASQLLCLPL